MIKITNGVKEFEVTRGAFDGIFSRQGYKIVAEGKAQIEENLKPEVEKSEVELLMEKPISQWTKTEVKKFAASKNIDISGTKNAGEAKEIIKEFIAAEE